MLYNGVYSTQSVSGTGVINSFNGGLGSSVPVSGLSKTQMTTIQAINVGSATVQTSTGSGVAALFVGSSVLKKRFMKFVGITFESGGGCQLYNTQYNMVKNCGFHSIGRDGGDVFSIGTNDGNWGNDHNLVEDCWIWGQNRLIALNYRADYNVWRRVVVRGDGCGQANCAGSGNPNVGFSVYNSSNNTIENMFIIDRRLLSSDQSYADFATAQHNAGGVDLGQTEYIGGNRWLGCASINSGDLGLTMEADQVQPSTITFTSGFENFGVWNSSGNGVNIQTNSFTSFGASTTMHGMTIRLSSNTPAADALRLRDYSFINLFNIVVSSGAGGRGVNANGKTGDMTFVDNWKFGTNYNDLSCSGGGCISMDPSTTGLKYVWAAETGSTLASGRAGSPYGADLRFGYGQDGFFSDDPGYDTHLSTTFWAPYPNEAIIKTQFGGTSSGTYKWTSTTYTFTDYIWQLNNNGTPFGSYAAGGGGGGGGGGVSTSSATSILDEPLNLYINFFGRRRRNRSA